MPADLFLSALSLHGAIFLAAIAAFHKYGDRTEVFEKSLSGTNAVIRTLRRYIAFKLAVRLKPVFDGASAVIEINLVDATGNPITEVAVNPVGSEEYNDALFDFIEANDEHLVDYKLLLRARDKWCCWAKILSWAILVFMCMEGAICALLIAAQFADYVPSSKLLWVSILASIMLSASCIVPLFFLLTSHDKITGYRKKYDLP